MTGSSTIALNFCPASDTSTSIACVRRTLTAVPAGIVTVFRGGAGAASVLAAGGGGGGGGGAGLRAENSTPTVSAIGISLTWPSSSRTRTVLLSAPMNMPWITLPDRSLTRSARSDTPTANTSRSAVQTVRPDLMTGSSLDNRKRCGDLQIDQQHQL